MDIAELTAAVEQVSQGYAQRFGITRDDDWQILKLHEELGELTQAHLRRQGRARTEGRTAEELDEAFGQELADVLGHVLLLAHHHRIDVVAEIRKKWLVRRSA
jgi:NTP pyrophosphatase (non-canonical NTP hydrolase)